MFSIIVSPVHAIWSRLTRVPHNVIKYAGFIRSEKFIDSYYIEMAAIKIIINVNAQIHISFNDCYDKSFK